MKIIPLITLFPVVSGIAFGATTANFDGGPGTPVTLQAFSPENPPPTGGATIETTGGNPGGYLQLTKNVNGQVNYATFDRSDAGPYGQSTFAFQFRIDLLGAGGADGFSFSYLPTATFGTTGGLANSPFTPEDPAFAGTLGFGFDTWGNGAPNDTNGNGSDYSEISVFYGGLVARIDDTRTLPTPLNLKDGAWHSVTGNVNFDGGTVSLSVDGNAIFTNLGVPNLEPYESRISYAGRTGGANERVAIDNVNVQYVPEPTAFGLLALSSMILLRRRR